MRRIGLRINVCGSCKKFICIPMTATVVQIQDTLINKNETIDKAFQKLLRPYPSVRDATSQKSSEHF